MGEDMIEEPGIDEAPDKPAATEGNLKPQNTLMRFTSIREKTNAKGEVEMVPIGSIQRLVSESMPEPRNSLLKRGTKISPRDEHSSLLD